MLGALYCPCRLIAQYHIFDHPFKRPVISLNNHVYSFDSLNFSHYYDFGTIKLNINYNEDDYLTKFSGYYNNDTIISFEITYDGSNPITGIRK